MISQTVIPIRYNRIEILHIEKGSPEISAVILHAYPARVRAKIVQIERRVTTRIEPFRSKSAGGGGVTRVESTRICPVVIEVSDVVRDFEMCR